jgi:ribosomal protein L37AE/L43A
MDTINHKDTINDINTINHMDHKCHRCGKSALTYQVYGVNIWLCLRCCFSW